MKRRWPDVFDLIPTEENKWGINVHEAWIKYLEQNLSKESLDLIAPPIEEPITITKQKFFECLKAELKDQPIVYYVNEDATNIPPNEILYKIGGRFWERLSGEK